MRYFANAKSQDGKIIFHVAILPSSILPFCIFIHDSQPDEADSGEVIPDNRKFYPASI